MKLAEALILRADYQKQIAQLQHRLSRSALVQEGEAPPENPQELISELETLVTNLTRLIQQINHTNAVTPFQHITLAATLAERDGLQMKRSAYSSLIEAASYRQERYMRSELRFVSTVDVADLQRQIDRLARDHRQLDTQIQALNWATDLIE